MGIFSFFSREKSSSEAKDRLKLVLIHDRTMLSSDEMKNLRDEIIDVISRYIDIDKQSLSIELAKDTENTRSTALIANIPLKIKR